MTEALPTTASIIWNPGNVVSTIEQCSGECRFNNGILEQRWILHRLGANGYIERIDEEWRPVPTVNDDNGELKP